MTGGAAFVICISAMFGVTFVLVSRINRLQTQIDDLKR